MYLIASLHACVCISSYNVSLWLSVITRQKLDQAGGPESFFQL